MLVSIRDGAADRQQQRRRLACGERSVRKLLRQRRSGDVLHRKVRLPVLLADFVDGDEVRVIEMCRGRGFRTKSRQIGRRRELAAQNHLERDRPPKR